MGGATIIPRSLKTTRNENNFFSFINPLHEPIKVFPKFDPLTAPGMALCVNLGPKCHNLFPLVSD
jgi:hypothetical protein